jgi:hypothetical protein
MGYYGVYVASFLLLRRTTELVATVVRKFEDKFGSPSSILTSSFAVVEKSIFFWAKGAGKLGS